MTKEYFISFILLFAFSIELAHNSIPHHHHDVEDMNHHSHHHHHENDNTLGYFAHINHSISHNGFDDSTIQRSRPTYAVDKNIPIGHLFLANKRSLFSSIFLFLKKDAQNTYFTLSKKKQTVYTTLLLRGPPSQTI